MVAIRPGRLLLEQPLCVLPLLLGLASSCRGAAFRGFVVRVSDHDGVHDVGPRGETSVRNVFEITLVARLRRSVDRGSQRDRWVRLCTGWFATVGAPRRDLETIRSELPRWGLCGYQERLGIEASLGLEVKEIAPGLALQPRAIGRRDIPLRYAFPFGELDFHDRAGCGPYLNDLIGVVIDAANSPVISAGFGLLDGESRRGKNERQRSEAKRRLHGVFSSTW